MKKIISIFNIIFILFGFLSFNYSFADDESGDRYFVVTAYYSPLPNQSYYLKGNYEAEKTLNGQGIRGASGKAVFPGMLAAPKNYEFGTAISLYGVGIGIVEDRGGAIVNAGQRGYDYDRIDIWMGYGEEGLKRALAWGKRTVKGRVLGVGHEATIALDSFEAPNSALKNVAKVDNIYSKGIGKDSSKDDITKLQELLASKGLYTGEIDGVYNSTLIDELVRFQIKNNLIAYEWAYGAGYWGTSTRKLVASLPTIKEKADSQTEEENMQEIKDNIDNEEVITEFIVFEKNIGDYSTRAEIKALQEIMNSIGKYDGEIDGEYYTIKPSILAYQKEKKLVKYETDLGAGHFGPATRKEMKNDYIVYLANEVEKERIELARLQKEAEEKKAKEEADKKRQLLEKQVEEHLASIGAPKEGNISPSVRELQKTLKVLGYFNTKDTAIYGPVTKEAIINYQKDKGLISSEKDNGAGNFGPGTKEAMKNDLIQILEDKGKLNLISMNY